LQFDPATSPIKFDGWVFETPQGNVPRWFCVAVPKGLEDFSRLALFFHPTPGQEHYDDNQYQNFDKWKGIYHYVPEVGYQLAASGKKLVFLMPLMPQGATESLGNFPAQWPELAAEVLRYLQRHYQGDDSAVDLRDVVVGSFSSGVKFLHTFLTKSKRVKELVREVYDFDGRFSTYRVHSEQVRGAPPPRGPLVRTYDQGDVPAKVAEQAAQLRREYHVGLPRWKNFSPRIPTNRLLHGWFPKRLFFHALSKCSVG
jgi:hypothetical protein